jgi:chromosome partitioning protein
VNGPLAKGFFCRDFRNLFGSIEVDKLNRILGVCCDFPFRRMHGCIRATGFSGGPALRVLALASQKGGSGKTTLSGHLAVQAQRAGAGPVVLIDIDPQGSLADWWNEREAEYPAFAQTTVARLAADLQVLRQQGFKLAVIDTPPAITMAIQSVIGVAELIVVPTRPSPHDLRAVGATVDLCERAGKPLIFVVNGATPKAKITSEAAVALSQHGTVAPITLHHRTDFAASMIDGRTVMEVDPEGRSATEITALWNYVSDRLEKNFRRTVFAAPGAAVATPGAAYRAQGGFGRRVAQ